jgi:hypothetical protein
LELIYLIIGAYSPLFLLIYIKKIWTFFGHRFDEFVFPVYDDRSISDHFNINEEMDDFPDFSQIMEMEKELCPAFVTLHLVEDSVEDLETFVRMKWVYKFKEWDWKWFMKLSNDLVIFRFNEHIYIVIDTKNKLYRFSISTDPYAEKKEYTQMSLGIIAIPYSLIRMNQ